MPEVFIILLLIAVVIWYQVRWYQTKRLLRDLREALEGGQKLLLGKERKLAAQLGVDALQTILSEKAKEYRLVRKQSVSQMDQIQTTFRHMREGALVLDAENRIQVCNRAAETLLNWGQPLRDRRVERFVHNPEFLDFVRRVRQGGSQEHLQVETNLFGRNTWLEVSGAPLESSDGVGESLSLFLLQDITPLKKLEAIRRDFVANVSHELRTPITIIKGFAETLYEEGETLKPDRRKAFTEKVYRNSVRLHELVEDLLSLSRLESTSPALDLQPRCLRDVVRSFAANYQSRRGGDCELRLVLPEEPQMARVDEIFVRQVLENLVSNAERYGETNTFVEIRLCPNPETGGVDLSVRDDGVGIPEKERERVFQRFYRVEKGRSTKGGGTGLGLSIVKHAMLAHGGSVEVSAGEPRGTVFLCRFPAASNG